MLTWRVVDNVDVYVSEQLNKAEFTTKEVKTQILALRGEYTTCLFPNHRSSMYFAGHFTMSIVPVCSLSILLSLSTESLYHAESH